MALLHLDFETFSKVDLAKAGSHRYLADESTEILLTAWALDHDPVQVEEGPLLPAVVAEALLQPYTVVVAFNAEFERLALEYVCNVRVPPERFICSMARAWSLGFVGGLGDICREAGFPADKHKASEGRRLMLKFAKPRRPSKNNPATRWGEHNDRFGWQGFIEYARQDVVASRELYAWCQRYPWADGEHRMWALDQRINDRGWPIDMELVRNANALRKAEEVELRKRLQQLTGLDNPNSTTQLRGWLQEHSWPLEDLKKATVAEALSDSQLPTLVRQVLELRAQLARATPKKWDALERGCTHGTIKASLEFGAAQRTQRWGGRIFQPQNLYTERELDTAVLAEVLTHANRDTVECLYGDVMGALAGGIRSAVTAPPGKKLVVCDYSSIESRLLGWFADEPRIMDLFAAGQDTYRDLAARLFRVPLESVTKAQRTYAKPPELGCGYYLGAKGLVEYAAGMGVTMDEDEARYAVNVWRESNPEVVRMWRWLGQACAATVQHHMEFRGYRVRFWRDEQFLFIELPSGRRIYYYQPQWHNGNLTYMGRYQDGGGAWMRVHTHPGKITENIIQACARDLLRDALVQVELEVPASIVGHVHDEIVCVADEENAPRCLTEMQRIMSTTPEWLPGAILGAEGFITTRYKKG